MVRSLKSVLIAWNASHSERVKLQYAYIILALIGIFVAGLVGLLNDPLSRLIVNVSLIILAVFVINALAWAILYGILISKIPKPNPPSKQLKSRRPKS